MCTNGCVAIVLFLSNTYKPKLSLTHIVLASNLEKKKKELLEERSEVEIQ
ncbi:hypothetical protein Scep_024845 [Stephania cephalantha]|uniref:Uncharacterized protein n=1 Tax=Stephania cephalantha TaxID=152367 RepID=A0AAP0HYU3_9MAGN